MTLSEDVTISAEALASSADIAFLSKLLSTFVDFSYTAPQLSWQLSYESVILVLLPRG